MEKLILNLKDEYSSDLTYKLSQFPDGQQQVKIYHEDLSDVEVIIKSRLNSFRDLEVICCAVASVKELYCDNIQLNVPYFLGARSDRKFEEGSNNYLKHVICPIINSLELNNVHVLDPHSDVLEACLDNFDRDENYTFVEWALEDIKSNNFVIVSPDAGALKKIYKVAEHIAYTGEIYTCSKERDTDGKLTKTVVPNIPLDKDIVIIDDICDGGRTFNNIIAAMDFVRTGKNYLLVTHGIFSAGFTELSRYFDFIYTTNSVKDLGGLDGNSNKVINVKQFNVF